MPKIKNWSKVSENPPQWKHDQNGDIVGLKAEQDMGETIYKVFVPPHNQPTNPARSPKPNRMLDWYTSKGNAKDAAIDWMKQHKSVIH